MVICLTMHRTTMHHISMVPRIPKDLVAASATVLVLGVLAKGDSYGYALIKALRERSNGALAWTEGMLYPVLHRLETQRCVEAYWEGGAGTRRRRYYRITEVGQSALSKALEQWRAVDAAVRTVAEGKKDGHDRKAD